MEVKKLFKGGFKRAVTFSFDDGQPQDMRVIDIMNKYGLKGTFNIIGGKCNNPCFRIKENDISLWDGSIELKNVYKGHEIASHGYTHQRMTEIDDNAVKEEIVKDVLELQKVFGYKMRGFAVPYGLFDQRIVYALKENGICYLRPTAKTDEFTLPDDFYNWKTNGHIANFMATEDGRQRIDEFFNCQNELPLLYLWGHSYELTDYDCAGCARWHEMRNRWEHFEELCKKLSGHNDTWYATNIQIYDYVTALRTAKVTDTYIDNTTDTELFFEIGGRLIVAPPHSRFGL